MSIRTILDRKGTAVLTVLAEAPVREAVAILARARVGALVVSPDGNQVAGIISERDVVAAIARDGEAALDRPVAETMSSHVRTCRPDSAVDDVMAEMTHRRIRHLPVVDDGRLAGIVSIGDVVKLRIDELEVESETLQEYVLGRGY